MRFFGGAVAIGDRVVLTGLVQAVHFNGRPGRIVSNRLGMRKHVVKLDHGARKVVEMCAAGHCQG